MDPYQLKDLQLKFISALFEACGGNHLHWWASSEIGKRIDLDEDDTYHLVQIMVKSGLIKHAGTGGRITITQAGNRLALAACGHQSGRNG